MAGEVSNQVKQLLKNDDSAAKLCVQGLYFLPFFLASSSSHIPALNNHDYIWPASLYQRQNDAITILLIILGLNSNDPSPKTRFSNNDMIAYFLCMGVVVSLAINI